MVDNNIKYWVYPSSVGINDRFVIDLTAADIFC